MIYGDGPRQSLTATFTRPLLRGIHSTPTRVAAVEQLLEFFDGKVERGEYLLEYGGAPILYYLTRTRPAAAMVWISPRTPEPIREVLMRRLLRDGRIPRYSIRTTREKTRRWRFSRSDVVNAYIVENYSLVRTIHEFEIWERRPR